MAAERGEVKWWSTDYRLPSTDYRLPCMGFRFEQLEVWQKARAFAVLIYRITQKFPREETFGLQSQIRRASVSTVSNIAEGSDRKSDVEFVRYLRMALTSLEEVVTQLYLALDLGYITQEEFNRAYAEANRLAAMINGLINSLNRGSP